VGSALLSTFRGRESPSGYFSVSPGDRRVRLVKKQLLKELCADLVVA
jgi:hypothetical protein